MTKRNVDLGKYDNSWFEPGRGFGARFLWYCINALFFNSYLMPVSFVKVALLRFFGAKVGKGVVIKPCVNIKYPWRLSVGDNSWIGENVWIDNLCDVLIGNNVCISQGAYILTGNHNYKSSSFDLIIKPVLLQDGVWIGAKAVVCPGVTCYSYSILTVGSVATSDLPEYSISSGNPASVKKDRTIA